MLASRREELTERFYIVFYVLLAKVIVSAALPTTGQMGPSHH